MAEPILSTSDLTRGEKLYIKRKRLGLSQIEMSVDLGVIHSQYRAMEQDAEGSEPPYISLGVLLECESYCVSRVRAGINKTKLAAEIGVSIYWLRQMERGDAPIKRLAEYWGD
jgi:transcriptional regulator with XRE-family HTH domain